MTESTQTPAPGPTAISLAPIGVVRGGRVTPEDDYWGSVTSVIELDPVQLSTEAVRGLGDFSHLEVVFQFHLCDPGRVERGSRHPRGRAELPLTGVLAQRVKDRPNHLGVSRCELVSVDGLRLHVRGLDAVDGTPVLDVKPFLLSMIPPSAAVREAGWVDAVMEHYYVDETGKAGLA
jgi:tRNA-Thr(GGU) m(6)t(6)A37 methyltransferase TsaA